MQRKATTLTRAALTLATLGICSNALAEEEVLDNTVAISASPIHLALPVAELQIEIYATERFSLAIIGGFGQVTVNDSFLGDQTFDVWEAGGQARGYLTGSTQQGLYLGAEVLTLVNQKRVLEESGGLASKEREDTEKRVAMRNPAATRFWRCAP